MSPDITTISNPFLTISIKRTLNLKNPKPRHRGNSTNTQHHLHDPTISSSKPASNTIRCGDIPKLTHANYDKWKDNMILILSAMRAYASVTGDDSEPQPLDFDHDDNYDDWKDKEHQQKTFPYGRYGCVRVDALRQSRQRHPGGVLLRAQRQYHASRCISPSDRRFAVSSRSGNHSSRSFYIKLKERRKVRRYDTTRP